MNVRLLRKVAKHISEEPRRFLMGSWLLTKNDASCVWDFGAHGHEFPICGTAACIGGWTVLLSQKQRVTKRTNFAKKARNLLAITAEQAERLFDFYAWPTQFQGFSTAREPKERVNIAIQRIEHFIKTKGKE